MATEEKSLFQSGYRAEPCWLDTSEEKQQVGVYIKSPEGKTYTINCVTMGCDCQGFFYKQRCKHTSNLVQLLIEQAAMYAEQRRLLPPIPITALERQHMHEGYDIRMVLADDRVFAYNRRLKWEEQEWDCLAVVANLKGQEWVLPSKFVCPEEEKAG